MIGKLYDILLWSENANLKQYQGQIITVAPCRCNLSLHYIDFKCSNRSVAAEICFINSLVILSATNLTNQSILSVACLVVAFEPIYHSLRGTRRQEVQVHFKNQQFCLLILCSIPANASGEADSTTTEDTRVCISIIYRYSRCCIHFS